jgi:hypothetical protein
MGLTRHEQIISIPASKDYLIVQAILSVKMTVDVGVSRVLMLSVGYWCSSFLLSLLIREEEWPDLIHV